jgi:hypothetical protein
VFLSVAALALLRLAWGRSASGRGVFICIGWGLAAASLFVGGLIDGEIGVATAVIVFSSVALAYVATMFVRAPVAVIAPKQKEPSSRAASGSDFASMRRIGVFTLAAVSSIVVATLLAGLTYALAIRGGAAPANAIVGGAVIAPLVWAGLVCWLLMDSNSVRRAVLMIALAAAGASAFALA